MIDAPTLPTGPLEHASMDYARLREEGLRLLGRLAGAQWTDFNAHDPGITILEQLCYAITDLGYRTDLAMPELLAGGDPWLPGPEAILTTDPVTLADLRRLALDVPGVGNAWAEESADTSVPIYHHAGSRELRLRADPAEPDAAPVRMRGLHRVIVQTTEQLSGDAARAQVAARLHAARALGSDLEVALAESYQVGLRAALEVDAVADPAALVAEIVERIEAYLAPEPRFLALEEARRGGRALKEILDGPHLARGFVEALPDRRRTVTVSDLIHAILDVPAVRAVRSLVLEGAAAGLERWVVEIPPGSVATLAPTAELTLHRDGIPVRVDPTAVRRRRDERRARRAGAVRTRPAPRPAPQPRPRDLTRHRSIQYQLPAAYGVGPLGLPASAPPARRAQARQLAAYLLIFDQLFANALAQLAHARELLSPGPGDRTYFAAAVADDRLGLDELRIQDPATHRAWLDGAIEAGDPEERRGRFFAHLLARFAEEPVADPRAFLRGYARSSRARGSGYDVSRPGDAAGGSGFEDRLRHKLGLRDGLRFHVVEHVLLRPLPEDRAQLAGEGEPQVPLLAGVAGPDPWSLQISIVVEEPALAGHDLEQLEQLVEQTIRTETPAHLTVHLHWLGDADGVDHWRAFEDAWEGFRAALRAYRDARLGGARMPDGLQLRARDARDRVIDLLGFGRTYPLRDLPLPAQIVVAPGTAARIPIGFGQVGVTYELRTREGKPIPGVPAVDGTGGPIELVTPPIDVDATFRILAVKQDGAGTPARREAWLGAAVRVIEGVDPALVARIRLPVLDPRIDSPRPSDARLGDWGVPAEVEVLASQEGVTYELIEHAADLGDVAQHRVLSAQPVVGTSGTIVLRTVALEEDVDLRVRGQRATGTPSDPVIRTGILDLVLPLRIRANPAVPVQVAPSVVAHGGAAVVRLEATQPGTSYRLHRGRVRDRDFVLGAAGGAPTVDVPGDGRTVRLARPPRPARWEELPDFAPVGDAADGGGGALELPIGAPVTEDTFLLVQASRRHPSGPLGAGSEELVSAVQLDRALAVLVRPEPEPALRLAVAMAGGQATGPLLVSGGQPGVFYELRLDGEEAPIGGPAYFHQRDDQRAQLNKGIDQLAIEVDAVIARDRPGPAGDPRTTPPPDPLLDTAPLPAGSVLRVRARKAMSGLTTALPRGAVLDDVPAIAAVPAAVAPGEPATIAIAASRPDERYRLLRDGQPVGDEVAGTGATLELPAGALEARTVFAVAVTRLSEAALAVERRVEVAVDVVIGAGSDEGADDGEPAT